MSDPTPPLKNPLDPERADTRPSSAPTADGAVAPATSAAAARDRVLLPWVFWPSAVIVLSFVVATLLAPEQMTVGIGLVQQAIITNFSWWYALVALFFVLFCGYLAFSRKGDITLGKPDEKPEFSTLSWFLSLIHI